MKGKKPNKQKITLTLYSEKMQEDICKKLIKKIITDIIFLLTNVNESKFQNAFS